MPKHDPDRVDNQQNRQVSFKFRFVRNKTRSPSPDPVNELAISAAGLIAPDKYSFAPATDTAQFGINPSAPAASSPKYGRFSLSDSRQSSPK